MRQVGVGVVGFGTVGAGVVDGLQRNRGKVAERLGMDIVLRKVADVDITSDRGVPVDRSLLTTNVKEVVGAPGIDIVVELVGGTGFAKSVVADALVAGQSVVTANKKLLAEYGSELVPLAESRGVELYFGAAVGGGIPIIRSVRDGLLGNEVESIIGILNGTCNYILTRMETEGVSFEAALAAAQREGYAEADPTLDVDGHDTLHKASILAALSYGFFPDLKSLSVQGIRGTVDAADIRYALELGYRIKLLAIVRGKGGEVEVRVAPTLVPLTNLIASVSGVFNAAMVTSDLAGTTLYYGRGAGRLPTASTVIGDIADAAFSRVQNAPRKVIIPKSATPVRLRPAKEIRARYYLRLAVRDQIGSMAKILGILAAHNVSISSVMQKEDAPEEVTDRGVAVIILTHVARAADIDDALHEISTLPIHSGKPVSLGIL